MNAKLLIIILGGLIVLFFVGTGWGLLSDDSSIGGAAETIVTVVRGLQAKAPLSPEEVIDATPANCRGQLRQRQFALAQGDVCQLEVGESSTPVRTLTLRLQRGEQVELRMVAGGESGTDQTEELPLDEGEDRRRLELQFVREGGRLTITCVPRAGSDDQCILEVLSS